MSKSPVIETEFVKVAEEGLSARGAAEQNIATMRQVSRTGVSTPDQDPIQVDARFARLSAHRDRDMLPRIPADHAWLAHHAAVELAIGSRGCKLHAAPAIRLETPPL